MNATQTQQLPARLRAVFTLAHLLERLERSPEPVGADQYRAVAGKLAHELEQVRMDDALETLLRAFPAASEIYENLNYQHAGLCRAPLNDSLNAELQAKEAISKAARPESAARG